MVLEVPAERGESAPKVQPGHQDSRDVVVHAPEQRAVFAVVVGVRNVIGRTQHASRSRPGLGMSRHVVQVPRVRRRRVLRRVARAVVGVPDSRERASVRGGVDIRAVVHVHGVPAALLHHAPEVLLDDSDRRALSHRFLILVLVLLVLGAEEARVELRAVRLKLGHRERLAGVEPQVLRVVRRGDAVGAEPVALGDGVERGGEAVRVVPASAGSGRRARDEERRGVR